MTESESTRFLFHPLLIHFPIAFFILEFALLVWWTAKKDDFFRRAAFLLFRFGFVGMLFAMVAGYIDATGINSMVKRHFTSALATAVLYSLRGILWFRMSKKQSYEPSYLTGSAAVGLLLVILTAYLGGLLVYR